MTAISGVSAVFYGSFVHALPDRTLEYLCSTGIGIDDQGTILFMEKDTDVTNLKQKYGVSDDIPIYQSPERGFFFPGFFDTHIHASQYPNVGIFGDSTLLDWLKKYTFPLEFSLNDLNKAEEVYSTIVNRTLSNGTTTAAYYATIDGDATNVLADVALKKKQRAFVGRVCMVRNTTDYYCHDSHESKKHDLKVIEHIKDVDPHHEYVCPILTPRFAPTCTEEIMRWLGDTAMEHDLPTQSHISENHNEIEWVRSLFPDTKHYADVYDRAGMLNDKTILAHAVHLLEEEKELISLRKSGISHCPISNSAIGSGLAPVRSLLNKDIKVGLGTDVSGGYSPSVLVVARHAVLVSREVAHFSQNPNDNLSAAEVLFLATLGGAQVCSMDHKLGNFVVGKKWDAQLVSLSNRDSSVDVFSWAVPSDTHKALEYYTLKWLYLGDDRNTRKVWVGGHLVHDKE